jgi:type II secretory pathway component PulK
MALPAVLWTLAGLMLMTASLTYFARIETRLTQAVTEQAQAAALMQAGVAYTARLMQLYPAQIGDQPPRTYTLEIDGQRIELYLVNTAGLIDPSRASPQLIADLIQTLLPHTPELGQSLLAALRPAEGAPTREAINDLTQLQHLPGMTDSVYNALRDVLTPLGGATGVNARLAPDSVLLILSRGDQARTEAYIHARQINHTLADTSVLQTMHHMPHTSQHYRLDIKVTLTSGHTFARRAWLSPTPFGDAALRVTRHEPLPNEQARLQP